MPTLRLGFVGAGFIAGFLARALQSVRGAEIAAIWTPNGSDGHGPALAAEARNLGVSAGDLKVCSSVGELVRHCDVVVNLAPNFAKVDTMEAIAHACREGVELKGLIVDKPLARNVGEGRRMVELASQCGCPAAYFENQNFMPSIRTQLTQLRKVQEAMGPLTLVRSAEEHGGPHAPWFWDPRRQGGGVVSDMGCHSIAVSWFALTPPDKPVDFMRPVSMNCTMHLLKWGQPRWRDVLQERHGIDYAETPAEDYGTGTIVFENPETRQRVVGQFMNSWMFEKQGLRLMMEGMGPGYAFEVNSLRSPLEVFIGDTAAQGVLNAEAALEKATASRGLLCVQPNEADLYGYVAEWRDAIEAFSSGRKPLLSWDYGLAVLRLVMAAYLSAEEGGTVEFTETTLAELDTYVPLIQQGRGSEVLFGR